jgi:hypothetical protein
MNAIFVFGSNRAGIHGAGSAREALDYWGAQPGVGIGRTGNAYAIPTKDRTVRHTLPLPVIGAFVLDFTDYAREHPKLTFVVTRIGCGLAGLSDAEVAPLFAAAADLPNVIMCDVWRQFIADRAARGDA